MPMAGFANCRLGDVWREKNELSFARDYLLKGIPQCEALGQPDILTDAYICLARWKLAKGEIEATHEILDRAARVAQESKTDPWSLCWLDDCRIRAWQAAEDFESINLWEQNCGLSLMDSLDYQHDLHHQNLARVLVIQNVIKKTSSGFKNADCLLKNLQIAANLAGWVHEEIRILVLKAINFSVNGFSERALQDLIHAAVLAQPGEYLRVFLDEGEILHEIFKSLSKLSDETLKDMILGINPDFSEIQFFNFKDYVSKITAAFVQTFEEDRISQKKQTQPGIGKFPLHDALVENLTSRETEVLKLLAEGYSDKKIAEELVISPETVHKHLKNIYSKLDVHSRTEAVIRAQSLELL